jgi:hypothetical protein
MRTYFFVLYYRLSTPFLVGGGLIGVFILGVIGSKLIIKKDPPKVTPTKKKTSPVSPTHFGSFPYEVCIAPSHVSFKMDKSAHWPHFILLMIVFS